MTAVPPEVAPLFGAMLEIVRTAVGLVTGVTLEEGATPGQPAKAIAASSRAIVKMILDAESESIHFWGEVTDLRLGMGSGFSPRSGFHSDFTTLQWHFI